MRYALAMALFMGVMATVGNINTYYSMDATVVNVTKERITVVDKTDNEWEFFGDGFTRGQKVKVTFDNNHTEIRYDDKIVKVK